MIAEAKEDVLVLSGSLSENHWDTIRTAATLLLKRHPKGIIIDCGLIDSVTEAGAKTFIEAMKYIESKNAHIIVANVPPGVKETLQQTLNVRSRLPFADTMGSARASLSLLETDTPNIMRKADIVLLPVTDLGGDQPALNLSLRLAQQRKAELHLVYFIEIPRALPMGTPIPEHEARALTIFEEVERQLKKQNVAFVRHIERSRDWSESLAKMVDEMKVETLVFNLPANPPPGSDVTERLMKVVRRLRCEIILYRRPLEVMPQEGEGER